MRVLRRCVLQRRDRTKESERLSRARRDRLLSLSLKRVIRPRPTFSDGTVLQAAAEQRFSLGFPRPIIRLCSMNRSCAATFRVDRCRDSVLIQLYNAGIVEDCFEKGIETGCFGLTTE